MCVCERESVCVCSGKFERIVMSARERGREGEREGKGGERESEKER